MAWIHTKGGSWFNERHVVSFFVAPSPGCLFEVRVEVIGGSTQTIQDGFATRHEAETFIVNLITAGEEDTRHKR